MTALHVGWCQRREKTVHAHAVSHYLTAKPLISTASSILKPGKHQGQGGGCNEMKNHTRDISPLMRKLSAYIAQAARRPLPAVIMERANHHLLDTLGAMVSGSPLLPG